ncbi:DUF6056 family protein [Lachnoclostridium sp. Marseille-P6806]|uniref:DUF6056 family protein n=1 Tax=Lachnoclostridium sp. Marseille-P6806 TaxID=2364793 RepID=UPI001030C4D1|nr:DUF6056 family protein [Lachnoclostridium sp. Marseille-P6806]
MTGRQKKTPCRKEYPVLLPLLFALHAAGLIPLLRMSFYAHPAADDYSSAVETYGALRSGAGLTGLLAGAFRHMVRTYMQWQGTWFSELVFSLQPGIFGQRWYFLTAFVMLGALMAAVLFFFHAFVARVLGGGRREAQVLSLAVLFVMVQRVPYPADSFYWWNGAGYYTLMFALMLFLAGALLRAAGSLRISPLRALFLMLAGAAIGGGNYTTALLGAELLAAATIFGYRRRLPVRRPLCTVLAALLLSFAVSAAAPGNAVRAGAAGTAGLSAASAIAASILESVALLASWADPPLLALLILAGAVLGRMGGVADGMRRSGGAGAKDRSIFILILRSLAVTAFVFLLFASQLTPPLYAIGNSGAERQIDIYYYSACILLILVEALWIRTAREIRMRRGKYAAAGRKNRTPVRRWDGVAAAAGIAALLLLFTARTEGISRFHSAEAVKELCSGEAAEFDAQYRRMTDALEEQAERGERELFAPAMTCRTPELFKAPGLSEDGEGWANAAVARYYGAETLRLYERP